MKSITSSHDVLRIEREIEKKNSGNASGDNGLDSGSAIMGYQGRISMCSMVSVDVQGWVDSVKPSILHVIGLEEVILKGKVSVQFLNSMK